MALTVNVMTDQVYRLLVTGSRTWEGILAELRVNTVLSSFLGLSRALNARLVVVHGDCPQGADAIARRWCDRRGVPQEPFPADWRQYGKQAGPLRNFNMANSGNFGCCVGFLRDDSRGTLNCLQCAREAKIPTFVVPWDTPEIPVVTYP